MGGTAVRILRCEVSYCRDSAVSVYNAQFCLLRQVTIHHSGTGLNIEGAARWLGGKCFENGSDYTEGALAAIQQHEDARVASSQVVSASGRRKVETCKPLQSPRSLSSRAQDPVHSGEGAPSPQISRKTQKENSRVASARGRRKDETGNESLISPRVLAAPTILGPGHVGTVA